MLRMALIASLIVLNLSVWIGPAEVLAVRGKALLDRRPQYERAQRLALKGDLKAALAEYEGLIKAEPDNASYHSEYALLCYNDHEAIGAELGWDRAQLIAVVQREMKLARDFSPRDYSTSAQYSLALMDGDFFGTDIPVEVVVEAWSHTLALVQNLREDTPGWPNHEAAIAHAYLQLARAEHRYGRNEEMKKYIEKALEENPDLRIPKDLRAS